MSVIVCCCFSKSKSKRRRCSAPPCSALPCFALLSSYILPTSKYAMAMQEDATTTGFPVHFPLPSSPSPPTTRPAERLLALLLALHQRLRAHHIHGYYRDGSIPVRPSHWSCSLSLLRRLSRLGKAARQWTLWSVDGFFVFTPDVQLRSWAHSVSQSCFWRFGPPVSNTSVNRIDVQSRTPTTIYGVLIFMILLFYLFS